MKSARPVLTIFFSLILLLGSSQYNFDYGIKLGATNYLGDIGGQEKSRREFLMDMKLSQTRWVAGGYARYKFLPSLAGNLSINYGRIQGDDALSSNKGRNTRNLRFRNNILEISAKAEYYVFEASDIGGKGRYLLDLKTFAHPEKADLQSQFSLSVAVESSMRFTHAKTWHVTIENTLVDSDITIIGSQNHIVQVLINLIENAAHELEKQKDPAPELKIYANPMLSVGLLMG